MIEKGWCVNLGDRLLWTGFTLFAVAFFLTYVGVKSDLRTFAAHDDALFVHQAESIASGHWLGDYHPLTLVKMPGYALFLSFVIKSGLPYLWVLSVFHIAAVAFLLHRSRYLFPGTGWLLLIAGFFLLFNPIFAGSLRIYRFQLTAIVFMVFLGSVVGLYERAHRRSHWGVEIFGLLLAALSWGLLWFSREENLLYTGCLAVGMTGYLLIARSLVSPWWNLRFVLSGLFGVFGFWLFIAGMNVHHYGRFIVCEKTASPYPDLMRTFFSIADPELDPRFLGSTASREKIRRVAMEVPEFQLMADNLIKFASSWRGTYLDSETLTIREKPEGALTVSHFEWAWMDAASASGYFRDGLTLAERYGELDEALTDAIADHRLRVDEPIRIQAGSYGLTGRDLAVILRLMPRVYPDLFFTPSAVLRDYRDLTARVSRDRDENKDQRARWASVLKVRYLDEGDEAGYLDCIATPANRFWNLATAAFAFIAIPLIHLATPLAGLTLVVAICRKRGDLAVAIAVMASTYLVHYLMLTALTVASGNHATTRGYFLPSFAPLILTAFVSIGSLWSLRKRPADHPRKV
ncbi:MAG: hypothetical protein R3F07_12845 [Opitutaceae bacterium]